MITISLNTHVVEAQLTWGELRALRDAVRCALAHDVDADVQRLITLKLELDNLLAKEPPP